MPPTADTRPAGIANQNLCFSFYQNSYMWLSFTPRPGGAANCRCWKLRLDGVAYGRRISLLQIHMALGEHLWIWKLVPTTFAKPVANHLDSIRLEKLAAGHLHPSMGHSLFSVFAHSVPCQYTEISECLDSRRVWPKCGCLGTTGFLPYW